MCNAKTHRHTRDELTRFANELGLPFEPADLGEFETPRYRIGPRQRHAMFFVEDGGLRAQMASFGMILSDPPQKPLFNNARSDSLTAKYPWKMHLRRLCLIPADGFFEPEKEAQAKGTAPWRFYQRSDGGLFWMAGLYSRIKAEVADRETGELVERTVYGYTVITTEAAPWLVVHNRMPVIFPDRETAAAYVTAERVPQDNLVTYTNNDFESWRVGDAAKSWKSPNSSKLIEAVDQGGLL
ncbi:MAG: SOS response-associated peptidase family protein [Pseudomonadota bacterium]